MLTAGYVDHWQYHKTYSGTPQGAGCSPILMNIYLHELDRFVEGLQQTFNRGTGRRWNPEYQHHRYHIYKYRKRIDAIKGYPSGQAEVARLRGQIEEHGAVMRRLPSQDMQDPNFRRLRYLRYADDTLLGVIGSKAEAQQILNHIRSFLAQELHVEVNEDKTRLRHIEAGCEFLGYLIRQVKGEKVMKGKLHGRHVKRRTTSAVVNLFVPGHVAAAFCHTHRYGDYGRMESHHRTTLLVPSLPELIATYNAELRGLAQYYALACDVKARLAKLFYLAHHSLYKTVANKLRLRSMAKVIRRLRQKDGELVYQYTANGKPYRMKVYRLKHLDRKGRAWQVDNIPHTAPYTLCTTELVARLNARICEYCGVSGAGEVHHIRKLADVKRKAQRTLLERMMIARARKTIVLGPGCHRQLPQGTLPDRRQHATG